MSNDAFIRTQNVPDGTVCVCGDKECGGLTAAFGFMRDARKRFVDLSTLPQQHQQAYLRHLKATNQEHSHYIALHHFHPTIFREHPHKIPKTLSLGQAVQLRLPLSEKDKVTEPNGMLAFLYCPTYSKEQVKIDLENVTPETRMQETADSVISDDSVEQQQEEQVVFDIPEHVELDDDLSDMSSIEVIVDHERDAITLRTLVSAANVCQVSLCV